MAGSAATSSSSFSFIFSTSSSSSVLCCLGGWRGLKPSWLLANFQRGQSERTDTGVGIPLPHPSPRPSLILFSCCAVSPAYCSHPCPTFQWGVGVGVGIPHRIFQVCILFFYFFFWEGGVVHVWWRDRRLALRPNNACEGTSVVGSGENIISWCSLKEHTCFWKIIVLWLLKKHSHVNFLYLSCFSSQIWFFKQDFKKTRSVLDYSTASCTFTSDVPQYI